MLKWSNKWHLSLEDNTFRGGVTISDYMLTFIFRGQILGDEELISYIINDLGSKYDIVVIITTSKIGKKINSISLQEAQFLL